MLFRLNNELFEWDAEKESLNYEKHRVHFETAARVFRDENRIELYDEKHSDDEDRYNTIGKVDDVLFVVYTARRERIRLISARIATPMERRIYHDSLL